MVLGLEMEGRGLLALGEKKPGHIFLPLAPKRLLSVVGAGRVLIDLWFGMLCSSPRAESDGGWVMYGWLGSQEKLRTTYTILSLIQKKEKKSF